MTKEKEVLNLWQKINQCGASIGYILREDKKVNNQYYPVSYNTVIEKCAPHMREFGLVAIPSVYSHEVRPQIKKNDLGIEYVAGWFCDVHMQLKIVNVDNPTEHETVSVVVTAWDTLDKAADKAITKAQRQCLQKLFLVPTYDEDDAPSSGSGVSAPVPAKESYTAIDAEQVATLQALAVAIKVPEEVVAKAADSSFTRLSQIPIAKYEEVKSRMEKRLAQLKGGSEK